MLSNALSREVQDRQRRGAPLIDLTNSNPTQTLDTYPDSAIAETLHRITNFRYEPNPLGSKAARDAVSDYYQERGIQISSERIVLTASTSEAYGLLFKLLCDPEDEVLVPAPSYPLFDYLARLESVRVSYYRLRFDGDWYIDTDYLRRQLTPRTRALVVVNPNNPTGSLLRRTELEMLSQIAFERRIPVISDEVFFDYAFEPKSETIRTFIRQEGFLSFSLNGLSKAAGMPQMKLAWIVINGPEEERIIARERLELICDTYLSVGTPVQQALPDLLRIGSGIREYLLQRARANLFSAARILQGGPAHVLVCEAGWSAIVRLPATQSEEVWTLRLLSECGILVQPGYFFDMESEPYVVISLITPPEAFEHGISCIAELAQHN